MTVSIRNIEIFVYRAPIDTPVVTSFGTMYDRPAVVVRLEDTNGYVGWGEVWCNYPTCGAEHRARLIETVFAPLLLDREYEKPTDAFSYLTTATHTLAIQTAEIGPIAQCIAGLDIAIWDIFARRENKPLFRFLGGSNSTVPVYASGINPTNASNTIDRARSAGYYAFKVKVGFEHDADIEMLKEICESLSDHERLMADANQSWNINQALDFLSRANEIPLQWLEEPIQADRPSDEWQKLAEASSIPIATGENIRGFSEYDKKIVSRAFGVIQPDICKWGGVSKNLSIVQSILDNNIRYCPHYLGGGIGLVASAHLLAAVGGDGMLEVDFNTNLLREGLANPFPEMSDGIMSLNKDAGLGVTPDSTSLNELVVARFQLTA